MYVPELLAVLVPIDELPGSSSVERARLAEARVRLAVEDLGGPVGDALSVLLGLSPGFHGRPLKDRRRAAADLLDILPDTFRRHYEGELLWDLAVQLS